MKTVFVTTSAQKGRINASAKAPSDIVRILEARGAHLISHPIPPDKDGSWTLLEIIRWQLQGLGHMFALTLAALRCHKNGILLLQYPQCLSRIENIAQKRLYQLLSFLSGKRTIIVLHDINSLRFGWDSTRETLLLNEASALLAHSQQMRNWLLASGITRPIEVLRTFDYLIDGDASGAEEYAEKFDVALAGNLSPEKCGRYILDLKNLASNRLEFLLFGNSPDPQSLSPHVRHCGAFFPNTPTTLHAHFGLVWDSDRCDLCCGSMGNYLSYIAPHKFSLYLASGIPVIVWNGSAMAELVRERDVGLIVTSLTELPALLASLTRKRYEALVHNARGLGEEMRRGKFLLSALDRLVPCLYKQRKDCNGQSLSLGDDEKTRK